MSLTGLAYLLAFLAGIGLTIFRNPLFGLYTYTAVFYLDAPNRWWGQGLPDLRWSLFAAVVTGISMMRLKPDPVRPPWYKTFPAWFLILYSAWLWIQTPWALDPKLHGECAFIFTKYIIVYFMVYRLLDTPQKAAEFLLVHVIGCFYLGWVALNTDAPGGRLDGVGGPGIDDSNTLGMHAAAIAIVGAMLVFSLRQWRLWLAIISVPLILNIVVKTGSRGAFLSLLAGGLTIFMLRPREKTKLFLGLTAAGVLAFGMVASDAFWERMRTLESAVKQDENIDNSSEGRIVQMKQGLVMSVSHPLGVGHRGFAILSPAYLDTIYLDESGARASHNTFISALVEQGIPGAILYAMLWLWVLKSGFLARRWSKEKRPLLEVSLMAAVCGGLAVVFVGGQFADFLKSEVQVWLIAVLASLKAMPLGKKAAEAAVPSGQPNHKSRPVAARY